jgi:hypothetical protein
MLIELEPGLRTHIDYLRPRYNLSSNVTMEELSIVEEPGCVTTNCFNQEATAVPKDLREQFRVKDRNDRINPSMINHISQGVFIGQPTEQLNTETKEAEEPLERPGLPRKRVDPLRRTRKGKAKPWKLDKAERRRLNKAVQESPQLIRKFLKD